MDNIKDFEDFEIEVKEKSQPEVEVTPVEEETIAEETAVAEEQTEVATEVTEVTEEEPAEATSCEEEVDAAETLNADEEVETEVNSQEQPAESTESNNELIKQLLQQIENLTQQNELLQKKFDNKIAADAHKAELFDKMYNELQSYKTDLYAKLLKPFILSTITLLDDTNAFLGKLGENESQLAEKFLRSMPDDLIDILESNGVVLYEDDVEKFNPRTQRAMKQVPTDKPELDNFIAKRIRKGYSWNGVNLKPELVWIYKFKQETSDK